MSDYDYDYDDFDDVPSDCRCSDCVGGDADVLDFDDNDDMIDYDVFYEAEMRAYEAELDAEMDALDELDPLLDHRAWRQKLIYGRFGNQYYISSILETPVTRKHTKIVRVYNGRSARKPHSRNRDRRREREQLREFLLDDELRDKRLAA